MENYVKIAKKDGSPVKISLADILKCAGVSEEDVSSVAFVTEKDGCRLEATVSSDSMYPGFSIDGYNGDRPFWLANVELPNESYPHDFVARLYAGCADYETDEPIAMVKSNADGENWKGEVYTDETKLTKNVFVDCQAAAFMLWREEDSMKEHRED